MAKNDTVLLDVLLERTSPLRSGESSELTSGEIFERFAIEQILKGYDLSTEEIEAGLVDGRHDGGLDGFYTFVNGRMIVDAKDMQLPRSDARLEVYLVTCRHRDSFKQEPLDALLASLHELLNLGLSHKELSGAYSPAVLRARDTLDATYRALALSRPRISFKIVYACRGDASLLGESVHARGGQIECLLRTMFSACEASFLPLGASELVEMHRQGKPFSLALNFSEHLSAAHDGYVVLANLGEYNSFIVDEQGNLRRYLFDSNVRDFLGSNRVNSEMLASLADALAPNFWWLNNGITILASAATVVGKQLRMQDIQIVNGLQTTESIYRHFLQQGTEGPSSLRSVLIKVIVTEDERVRDNVIRATNNQSVVETSALHATDKIQHDIEQILATHDWYYERRTNYFKNAGKPTDRIVSPSFLAEAVVSILFKNPIKSALKTRSFRDARVYASIFSTDHPITVWSVLVASLKRAERSLTRCSRETDQNLQISRWRGVVALIAMVKHFRSFFFAPGQLANLKEADIEESAFDYASEFVLSQRGRKAKPNYQTVKNMMFSMAREMEINGSWSDSRIVIEPVQRPTQEQYANITIDDAFLDAVHSALPQQPWPKQIHQGVAATLKCSPKLVQRAISVLIHQGRRHHQIDGLIVDA